MGKNKAKNNVFKVAGAKSLKAKTKAKPVELKLKKLTPKIKEQIAELDVQLKNVNNLVRSSESEKPKKAKATAKPLVSHPPLSAETEEKTLDQLNDLQFN